MALAKHASAGVGVSWDRIVWGHVDMEVVPTHSIVVLDVQSVSGRYPQARRF